MAAMLTMKNQRTNSMKMPRSYHEGPPPLPSGTSASRSLSKARSLMLQISRSMQSSSKKEEVMSDDESDADAINPNDYIDPNEHYKAFQWMEYLLSIEFTKNPPVSPSKQPKSVYDIEDSFDKLKDGLIL